MKTNYHLTEEEIALCSEAINQGRLDEVDEKLLTHLDDCAQCAGEVMMVAELANETIAIEHVRKKPVKAWLYISMLAAAVAITFLVINIPNLFVDKSAIKSEIAVFVPNEELEKLVENMQVSYRDNDIIILTESSSQYPETDSLRWKNPENQILTVEWYNNEGTLVKSEISDNQGVKISGFPEGLYYWKLINEDFDLLGVGKVIINKVF